MQDLRRFLMIPIAVTAGILLSLGLIVAGVARKKSFLYMLGAVIGLLLAGYGLLFLLVNSPLWTM